jgi:hypothetical protein
MKKTDAFEKAMIEAYENGALRSTMPSKSALKALREAARATSKFVAGRLVEKPAQPTPRSRRTVRKRTTG